MDLTALGKLIVVAGLALAALGALLLVAGRLPFLGHLPGDISIQRGNTSFSFPLVTCILISIVLTVLLNLLGRHSGP